MKHLVLVLLYLNCVAWVMGGYSEDFLNTNFQKYFSKKLKIYKTGRLNEYKLICLEKIEKEELIYRIPFSHSIKADDKFTHEKEIIRTVHDMHVNENMAESVTMIVRLLFGQYLEQNGNREQKEFLNSIVDERDTLLWWNKNDLAYFKSNVYNYNDVWVENMVKETENIISLTKDVIHKFEETTKIELPGIVSEENELRNKLEFLHKNSVFLTIQSEWENLVGSKKKGPQPIVLPLFDLIKKGKTKKDFDTNRKCRIDLNSGQVNNFLNFEGDYLEHHSDCEFEQDEEYFILTRTGSSFENFLTYGYINEFETYDLMEIILTDHISLTERDFLSSIDVINKEWEFPFFYLDNKRINIKLRDFFIVKSLTKRKKKLTQEIFKKKLFSIEDVDIFFEAYLSYRRVLLDKLESQNSTLEIDEKNFESFKLKKKNKEEKFKKNVLLLKLMQRRVLEEQLRMINEKILQNLFLKEQYLAKSISGRAN